MTTISYTELRDNKDYESLKETLHLLRNPANAELKLCGEATPSEHSDQNATINP